MTTASVNDPCECGQTTIRGCADMPSRHCGAWEETAPSTFTAHELSALAEQGMTLTEAEEATVRNARGQTAQPATDIRALLDEIARLRDDIIEKTVQHEQRVEEYWAEIERLRAELAGQRMCVNCGKYAPAGHDRTQPLPECVGPDDMAACTFDLTPSEAWQHWSKIAHDLRADNAELRDAFSPLLSQLEAQASWQGQSDFEDDLRRARTAMEASNG